MFHACHRRPGGVKVSTNECVFTQALAGANRRWRCPFRCRGSRRKSAVAQLFSLGVKIGFSFELVRLLGKISVVRKEEVEAVRSS
jgi:hypothetical protein